MFGIELDLLLAGAIIWGVFTLRLGLEAHSRGIQTGLKLWDDGRLETVEAVQGELIATVTKLEAQVDQLPHTWEEMHHKVRRTEERTRGSVRRAMAELEEHGLESPELTEISRQLRIEDAPGGNGSGVPSMPEGVGNVPPGQPAPDDWQAQTLAYKYGRR